MFYRRKYYTVRSEFLETFNSLFESINLPNQLKHGARLVGRWMMDNQDGTSEVFAIWEYDSYDDYVAIEKNVKSDEPHLQRIRDWYEQHGGRETVLSQYILEVRNEEIKSTVKSGRSK